MAAKTATLEAIRTSVLRPVTPTGNRGCSGGGQTAAPTRSTRNAETRPAKNITSAAIRNIVARIALSNAARRGDSPSEPSPPPVGGRGGLEWPLVYDRGRGGVSSSRLTSGSPPAARPGPARP